MYAERAHKLAKEAHARVMKAVKRAGAIQAEVDAIAEHELRQMYLLGREEEANGQGIAAEHDAKVAP